MAENEYGALCKIPGERRERRKWTPKEDVLLCSSWLNTNKDGVVENLQKPVAFWKRITACYNSSPELAGLHMRESSHCKQRWKKINNLVSKFVSCYEAAKSRGYNDTDVLKAANEIFYNDHKVKFNLEHAWIELRNDQKWCASSSRKGDGSSKRRKLDDQSSSSHTVTHVEDQGVSCPQGLKASKAKAKSSVSKSGTVEREGTVLSEFESMWTIKEKDLAMQERLKKMGILNSLIAKTEPLSKVEHTLKKKLITDIFQISE